MPGDFIQSLANGEIIVLSGYADIVAIQGISKASNILTPDDVTTFATDRSPGVPSRRARMLWRDWR